MLFMLHVVKKKKMQKHTNLKNKLGRGGGLSFKEFELHILMASLRQTARAIYEYHLPLMQKSRA